MHSVMSIHLCASCIFADIRHVWMSFQSIEKLDRSLMIMFRKIYAVFLIIIVFFRLMDR